MWEWGIGSNPQLDDTDGDGLDELEEYDPQDQAGPYSEIGLEEAALRCGIADQCLEPVVSEVLGTDILEQDTDGDSRTDGDEVNVAWTVSVMVPCPTKSCPIPWRMTKTLTPCRTARVGRRNRPDALRHRRR